MNEKELKEILKRLEDAGWEPMLCDTPVPYFRNGVPAGFPQNPGDYDGEYEMVPKSLLKLCDFIVSVKGDSMCEADINSGDDVIVKKSEDYEDGDIVVAYMDGETTLKSICHDEDEVWLVPANEAYPPFRLSEYQNVYILGKVTSVRKRPVRMSYSNMQRRLSKVRRKPVEITDARVYSALTQVLPDIKVGRMWFCVYHVLVTVGYLRRGDYEGLKTRIDELIPDNDFKINPHDISRMDVSSFAKRISLWDENDAPVSGKRFKEYKALAETLLSLLQQ